MEAEQRGTRTAEMGWGGRERDWADAQLGHSSRSWRWPSAGSLLRVSHQDSCAVAVLWIAHHRCATITTGLLLGNTVSRHAAVVGDSLPSEKLAVSTHTLPRFMTNRKQANQRCSFSLLDVGMLMLESHYRCCHSCYRELGFYICRFKGCLKVESSPSHSFSTC